MPLPWDPEEIRPSLTAGRPCFQLTLKPVSMVYSLGKTGDHLPGSYQAAPLRDAAGAWYRQCLARHRCAQLWGKALLQQGNNQQQDHGLGYRCSNPVSCKAAGTTQFLTSSKQESDLGNYSNLQPGLQAHGNNDKPITELSSWLESAAGPRSPSLHLYLLVTPSKLNV